MSANLVLPFTAEEFKRLEIFMRPALMRIVTPPHEQEVERRLVQQLFWVVKGCRMWLPNRSQIAP